MQTRRQFCALAAVGALRASERFDVAAIDRDRVLAAARKYLSEQPITITAASSPRSAGGKHDFFSEGDYWWPDPKNPDAPYIQRDGMTNPDNFVEHRRALMRLSVQMPALTSAWVLTREERYAAHAAKHLRAWFVEESTCMNPHLLYAQAIHGRATGRGTGVIDTIHLVEVVRAAARLEQSKSLSGADRDAVKQWFSQYVRWLTTHEYGIAEREAKNNHGTCWVMQAGAFATYTGNHDLQRYCRERYRTVLLPNQMAADGSFPLELKRTKPYGYSLFNLDAMTTVCRILSTSEDDLWKFRLEDGRSIGRGVEFMFPYMADKKKWPYPPDVMYFDQWPARHCSLLFAGLKLDRPAYLEVWRRLNPDPSTEEGIRNFFIRQPVLWV